MANHEQSDDLPPPATGTSIVTDPRIEHLEGRLSALSGCLVAFSGGVDSTFLLAVAQRALGDRVAAVTVRTIFIGREEIEDARRRAAALGVRHEILELDLSAHPAVLANPPDRCYHCKRLVFSALRRRAGELGLPAVIDATHADDLHERRPGLRALSELGVVSPLFEEGLGKEQIRELSAQLGIEGSRRPANPCLATRIPFGETITQERLRRIAGAEQILRLLGFEGLRVRDYGDLARIELRAADLERAALRPQRRAIVDPLRDLGYRYVTLDLDGYRAGSMDEALPAADCATPAGE